jgi:decaprenyl-phosphate phosphoribosyltransferase
VTSSRCQPCLVIELHGFEEGLVPTTATLSAWDADRSGAVAPVGDLVDDGRAVTPSTAVTSVVPKRRLHHLLRGLRPRQWSKNVLVFVAPAAAGVLDRRVDVLHALGAFALFCVVASGTYLVNDALDAQSDRQHPDKRHRPVAAGVLSELVAVAVGSGLMAVAVVGAVVLAGWVLGIVIGTYAVVSVAYSIGLKRVPVIELAVVAAGFALRAIAGGAATHVPLSSWFLAVTSFGALFVVTGKRAAEYATLGEHGHSHRAVLAQYTSSFLQSTLTLTSSVTVTTYCLWAFDKAGPATRAGHRFVWIQLTVVPMILGVLWVLRLLDSGQGGAPEDLALYDHVLQAFGVVWLVLFSIGLYG